MTSRQGRGRREIPRQRAPRRAPSPVSLRIGSVSTILRSHQELLRNAGSLVGTTGVTSLFGFAYWIYAARFYPTVAVGYGSAAISTMLLLGTVGESGIGTMLMGELPRGRKRGELITASLIASFCISFILGLCFSVVSLEFGKHFVEINGAPSRIAIFSLGVALSGFTQTFDEATIGLLRGGLQLQRNVIMSIVKMGVLPAAAFFLHDHFGVGIMLAWVVGIALSMIPTAITIKRGGAGLLYRPDWQEFWRLRKIVLSHNALNLAIATPVRIIPALVAIVVSPAANGAFYIAMMISGFLSMVPTNLSTVLFAIASATPELIGEKLRFVLRTSLYIGIPVGLLMGLCAHSVLSIFGPGYATLGTGPLWIMIIGYIPGLPSIVYIAVARATGKINRAAGFFAVSLAIRVAAVVIFGKMGGLYGLSYGMLGVLILQAFFTAPPVLRAAFGTASARSSADPVTHRNPNDTSWWPDADEETFRNRQESGLAALIAIATTR